MKKKIISLILAFMLILPSVTAFAEDEENIVDLTLIETMINYIDQYYKYDITKEELVQGAYHGITEVLDKHSSYYSKKEYADFMDSMKGSFVGIGVYIENEDDYIKVISPIEGSPAFKAGLQTGDLIVDVDGIDIKTISFEKAIDMIKGIEDTTVVLKIRRPNVEELITKSIVREVIIVESVFPEMLDNKIGYIKVTQFDEGVSKRFSDAILKLQSEGMTSLIVDLRNNPGGYLNEVIEMSDWFVEKEDPIVHIDYKTRRDEDYYAQKAGLDIPLAVLINGGSASASEIFASAIKNNDEGEIIGTLSYGKGTVQNIYNLPNGEGMKLTTAEYLAAGRESINNIGVTPDFVVEQTDVSLVDDVEGFAPFNERKLIQYGNIGLNTYALQQRLNFLGYELVVDGMFGNNTLTALNNFQVETGLSITKSFNNDTKLQLEKSIEEYLLEDHQLETAINLLIK